MVAAVAALSGWDLSTELQAQIVLVALGVVGLIGMLFPDSGLGGKDARPAGAGDRPADKRLHGDDLPATDSSAAVRFNPPDPDAFKDLERFGSG